MTEVSAFRAHKPQRVDNKKTTSTAPVVEYLDDNIGEDVSVSRDEVEDRCKVDFNFLAALAMPEAFIYLWPMIYISCFQMMQDIMGRSRDFSKFALGFPRGFAKSTFVKIVVLWAILFTRKKFILILCATGTLAENFVSDVADMLSHPNIVSVFGNWKAEIETDRNGYKKFKFRGRAIILAGIGAGSSLRGIVVKNARPDLMIFDDVQTKEQSESKVESESLERWFWGTAMKAKSPHGCSFFFLANMYPTMHSMLRKLKTNSTWIKFITGAILSDGKSLWEELQPLGQLLEEYQADCEAGHPEIFLAEVMNDENIQNNNLLDVSKVIPNPYELMSPPPIPHGKAIVIDPALDKKESDLVSIGYHEYFHNERTDKLEDVMTDKEEGHFSPGQIISIAIAMGLKKNCSLICVEGGSFQTTLLYWFTQTIQRLGLRGFIFREINHKGQSKNSRVFTLFKQLHSSEVLLHSNIRAAVLNEGREYNPAKTNNVDGLLDVTAYGPLVAARYPQEITAWTNSELDTSNSTEVIEDNSFF